MSSTETTTLTSTEPGLKVEALKGSPLGARVTLPEGVSDPSKLSDSDFKKLFNALHEHLVLVIPDQANLDPKSQHELTMRFDPTCQGAYGHAKEFRHDKSVLRRDGVSVPDVPQVQILGQGHVDEHCGLKDFNLRHPIHDGFHKEVLTDEQKKSGETRFYRWHIDAALYALSPPVCTTLLGINVPKVDKRMKIKYEDSGEELDLAQAATSFVSGANAFDILSDEDKKMVLGTKVVYPPHPFIWINDARATSDGLTMVSEGKEIPMSELPEWEESKLKVFPLVWTNPVTGKNHMQVAGCAVRQLILPDGTVLDTAEARKEIHRLMRPAISPKHVYAHDWNEGDLVLFFNRGVWHSVTGQFEEGESRLMHQCNVSSGIDPVCKA